MRAEPPRRWTTPDQIDAEVVWLAEVATGRRQAITPSLWTYTVPTTDGTAERGNSKRDYALMADAAAEASLEGHLPES